MRTGLNRQVGSKKYDFADDGKLIGEVLMDVDAMNSMHDSEGDTDPKNLTQNSGQLVNNSSQNELTQDELRKGNIIVNDENSVVIQDSLNFKTLNNSLYYHDDEFIVFIGFIEVTDGIQYFSLAYHFESPNIIYINGSPVNLIYEKKFVMDELKFDFEAIEYVSINDHKYVFDVPGLVMVDENTYNFTEDGSELLDLFTVEGEFLDLNNVNYHFKEDATEIFEFLSIN